MAEKSVTVQNKDTLEEVLKSEKDPEVRRKLSFALVAAGMEVKEAVTHFGACVTTGYHWVRHWNSEGLEGLRPKKIPGRPARLDEEMLERLKSMLEIKPACSRQALLDSERGEEHKATLRGGLFR